MTQENAEALATQEQGAVIEESQSTDTQEPDWQARAEAAEANTQKLENDLRSERGRRTRDQAFVELADDVGGMKAQLAAIAKRTASGEIESLPEDFAKIDQASAVKGATRHWESNYAEAEQSLAEALMDDDNNVIVSKEVVASIRELWQDARGRQDLHSLYKVVNQANREARLAEKTKVETEAATAKKVSDSKHGIHDLSLPNPAGAGGGGKSWAAAQKITSLDDLSDADYEKLVAAG